jgi:hypothetical protein
MNKLVDPIRSEEQEWWWYVYVEVIILNSLEK